MGQHLKRNLNGNSNRNLYKLIAVAVCTECKHTVVVVEHYHGIPADRVRAGCLNGNQR